MSAAHTPGPWEVCNSLPLVVDADGQHIAVMDGASTCWPNKAAVDANACLVAAAPEMERLINMTILRLKRGGKGAVSDAISNLECAIAKVEGRES